VSRPVSEYALGDFRWLATIRTLAEGVAAIALAMALRRERAAALLLVVVGLLKLAIPLFPVDALGMPATPAGQMHNVLGNIAFFLFSFGGPPAVPSAAAEGKSTRSRNRCGTGDCDGRSARGERRRGFGLAQRAYLILSALWLLFAALAVLRDVRAGLGEAAAG